MTVEFRIARNVVQSECADVVETKQSRPEVVLYRYPYCTWRNKLEKLLPQNIFAQRPRTCKYWKGCSSYGLVYVLRTLHSPSLRPEGSYVCIPIPNNLLSSVTSFNVHFYTSAFYFLFDLIDGSATSRIRAFI